MSGDNDLAAIRESMAAMPAAECGYQEWLNVGMALKDAGGTVDEWDAWSAGDAARYHAGECAKKWRGFNRDGVSAVGAGSIVKAARDRGHKVRTRREDAALEWDAEIGAGVGRIATGYTATLPTLRMKPTEMLAKYVETLFQPDDVVGYVVDVFKPEGSDILAPKRGNYRETAGALLGRLAQCKTLEEAIGDWDKEAGAWIRFNPLDGKGVADSNVKAWRYALVESDKLSPEEAYGIYTELQLPIAALVTSAGKSLHAIVRVDAPDYREYQKRVDFLYETCKRNGLEVDRNNRNPSRLSRLPGATRKGKRQELVAVNIGQPSWEEWQAYMAEQNDDLPEIECLADILKNPPPLAAPLIDGVLRQGHKMLLSGPSKAGKSYLLLELAIAIAEGWRWLRWQCTQGNVLYINLELDRATCIDRIRKQYAALGQKPAHADGIDVWHLRGHSMPLNDLVPRLLRRALKRRNKGHPYSACIIDPIYKVLTGDENAADQMAAFCNQFDRIATELGTAVIYCHHHSKGTQGQKFASDRASGSGVFARDPDAIIDMLPLDVSSLAVRLANEATVEALGRLMAENGKTLSATREEEARMEAIRALGSEPVGKVVAEARAEAESRTAWQIETILREFRNQKPFRIWYRHPLHHIDARGELDKVQQAGAPPTGKTPEQYAAEAERRTEIIHNAYARLSFEGPVTLDDMCRDLKGQTLPGCSRPVSGGEKQMRDLLKKADFEVVKGIVKPLPEKEPTKQEEEP